jgi:hypothetical protein
MKIEDFNPENLVYYFDGCTCPDYYISEKNISPSTYLRFSKEDIAEEKSNRNLINAVGNAKRAFHLRVEMLCDAFGWQATHATNRIYGFPERLSYLSKCGLLSPNILKKLNRKRNIIEHDYYIPSCDEVEDYIDIVELFLMATKSFLNEFPADVAYELEKDEYYEESLMLPENIGIELKMCDGGLVVRLGKDKFQIPITASNYFTWLTEIMARYVV